MTSRRLLCLTGAALLFMTATPAGADPPPAADPQGPAPPAQTVTPADATTTQPADAATTEPATPAEAIPKTAEPQTAQQPVGPKFLALRYDEDFSYLDGPPGSYKPDFFDPIKNIHLSEDWRLRLGGEYRVRVESETNRSYGLFRPTQDTYSPQHLLLHANLEYRKLVRFYLEGVDAPLYDRDLPQFTNQENRFDLNQAFIEARILGEKAPLSLRVGRQEMPYGRDRIIERDNWANNSRKFDAVKLFYRSPKFDIDFFYAKPVLFAYAPYRPLFEPKIYEGLNRKPDHWREQQDLFGMYSVLKLIPKHTIDVYFLGMHDSYSDDLVTNANGRLGGMGGLTLYTVGTRFAGTPGDFDYELEATHQFGEFATDRVAAWQIATDNGYTFKCVPWTPRFGVGFDYATGDRTPGDGSVETYNRQYGSGHAYLGYLDLVNRANIIAPNVSLSFVPMKDLTTKLTYYHFWLDSPQDALYSVVGTPPRRDPSGSAGRDVGDELDLTITWQIDPHQALLLGASHFWPGNFINSTGFSKDADLLYLQYTFKF